MKATTYLERHMDDILREFNKKASWEKYKKAEEICKKEIDRFYSEYTPRSGEKKKPYKRQRDLYNVYNLDIEHDGTFVFELGDEFMKKHHRVENVYIYETMFQGGWHGGADDGPKHPNPGKPYWRVRPFEKIGDGDSSSYWWTKQAPKSSSPYDAIKQKWNIYINGKGKEMELQIWRNTLEKYLRREE